MRNFILVTTGALSTQANRTNSLGRKRFLSALMLLVLSNGCGANDETIETTISQPGDAPLAQELAAVEEALQASPADDPNDVTWVSERDLSSAEFSTNFTKWKNAGYRMIGINVESGKYAATWRQGDGKAWAEYRDLTSDEYGAKWQELKDQGYRPLDIEAYQRNGALNFAGIWIKAEDGLAWASFRNLTNDEFGAKFTEYRDAGYVPTNVDAYQVGSEWRYAVIWVKNKDNVAWALNRNMTAEEYATKWQAYKDQGLRLVDFESYQTSSGQRYAAIWYKNSNNRGWASYRDMTELAYANRFRQMRDQGYRVVDFERYSTASGTRYAGVWRQNGESLSWAKAAAVDNAIKNYVSSTNLPGLSVAIGLNNNVIFRRGYGYADVAAGKEAHSETVYDAASVSKVIGATLLMRLRQSNTSAYDLNRTTRSYVAGLPSHHTHKLGQLLNHTGCVHHYSNSVEETDTNPATNPAHIDELQYNSQATAAAEFWSDKLICTPPSSGNNYSTHAFTFVGAVLEAVSGSTVPALVRTQLNEPFKLSSLRVKYPLVSDYERSALYTLQDTDKAPNPTNNKNVAITQSNTSWKTLGGGLEVSPYDLARFGIAVRSSQIVSTATRDTMWTTTAGSYGIGWGVSNNFVSHSGSAEGARSYIRVYTGNDNVVIAIMSNRRDHSINGLDINDLADSIKTAMQ
jgi:CubicO group peptidase (beta-lactamase class C family)